MANLFSLEGKNAWITGASYGIGFNIAKAFVAAGIKTIIFNDINDAALERGLANYKEAGIENVKGYVCDVTDENAVKALVEKIHAEVGNIDILVNNAGIIKRIPMHEMKRAEFQQVIDIDLVGPFICSSAVIPEMMERKEGKIINICSMMSELGRETVSAYAAAKGGLKMLTRNICSEYGEYNIQCNGIGPGYIATPQTAPLRERQPDGSRHPFDSFICAKTPAGRWLDPSELGGPAVFLASHASDAVNGHVLYVDGGILAYQNRLECISKLSTWLKLGNLLGSNRNLLLCCRIDALTSRALVYAECTEANQRNLLTSHESILNSCYCSVKSLLCITLRDACTFCNLLYQFCFVHNLDKFKMNY